MFSRSVGYSSFTVMKKFHFPLIKGALITSFLLVFVDCVKELPITLLLRPFNFETLSTNVYLFASDEMYGHASLGALTIVLIGIIPVIIMTKLISNLDLSMNILELKDVKIVNSLSFKTENITFSVKRGENICVVGPSGCGKTTILRSIAGFANIVDGEINYNGNLISTSTFHVPPENRKLVWSFRSHLYFLT